MRQLTNVKPLITNFMTARSEEEVSLEVGRMYYDPQTQITIFECGSNGPTRSGIHRQTYGPAKRGGYFDPAREDERPHTDD